MANLPSHLITLVLPAIRERDLYDQPLSDRGQARGGEVPQPDRLPTDDERNKNGRFEWTDLLFCHERSSPNQIGYMARIREW